MKLPSLDAFSGLTPSEVRLVLTLGPGAFVMASTIGTINIGLPAVQDEFGVSLSALKWVSITGAIMMASLSLCFGRIADNLGRTNFYKAGFALYTVFSLLVALSSSFTMLMGFRIVTAIGVAMSLPLGLAIAASECQPEHRGRVIGLLTSFTAAGQLAGPSLGGFALDLYGWRGIFLANMIVAGICCLIQHFTLRDNGVRRQEPFDFVGALLLFLGYPALLIGLSLGPNQGWDAPFTLAWFAFGIAGLAAFLVWELHTPKPLFRFASFRSLTFSVAMFTLFVASFVQNPVTIFAPIYLQRVLEVGPLMVGVIMMALPISTFIAGPIGGSMADKHDPRLVAAAGALLTTLAIFAYSQLGIDTRALYVVVPLVLLGLGFGLFRPANQVSVFAGVQPSEYGSLSAMLQSLVALSSTLGATITVALMERHGNEDSAGEFAEAQQSTFMLLLPLLILAVLASFLGRVKRFETEPASQP